MVVNAATQSAGNWTQDVEHEHAPQMPSTAWWFYLACKEGRCIGLDPRQVPRATEHGLDERADCTSAECARNAKRVERARGFNLVGQLAQRREYQDG